MRACLWSMPQGVQSGDGARNMQKWVVGNKGLPNRQRYPRGLSNRDYYHTHGISACTCDAVHGSEGRLESTGDLGSGRLVTTSCSLTIVGTEGGSENKMHAKAQPHHVPVSRLQQRIALPEKTGRKGWRSQCRHRAAALSSPLRLISQGV